MSNNPTSSTNGDTAPELVPVIPVDYLIHTDTHPFCYEGDCDCHEDQDAISEVNFYYQEGLISADDATRIVQGKTI